MIGRIVCSKAGSDKCRLSVIVKTEKDRVFVCDGKRHKLLKPKQKNLKHLSLTETTLNASEYQTDKKLRKALAINAAILNKE